METPTIKSTTQYHEFKLIRGNRRTSPDHINMLAASIEEENLLASNPIIVNEKMEIIDGQHRLEAARKLGVPIYYVITKRGLHQVQYLNATQRNWSAQDYLDSYILQGHPDYLELQEYIQSYPMSISSAVQLLSRQADARYSKIFGDFKNGKFRVTSKGWAVRVGEFRNKLLEHSKPRVGRDKGLIYALVRFLLHDMEQYGLTHEDLLKKYEASGHKLDRLVEVQEYLRAFESMLNWHRKEDQTIRLY